MQKIPSLFKRDYDSNRRLVYDEVVEGCEWVLEGEGVATRKWDGTCCRVLDGALWRRHDRKKHKKTREYKPAPEGWEPAQDPDPATGHWPGWVPVGDGPEDKWYREAKLPSLDGTYELCGPKIQGNPEGFSLHVLVPHGEEVVTGVPRDFDRLKAWMVDCEFEGIVWHHPDGRMCKIKKKDFWGER